MRFHSSTGKAARAAASTRARRAARRGDRDEAGGAEVGGHEEDGVAEVDGAAASVGEATLVEDLQEELVDVAVGLLDLVEEDDAVRAGV
jgi:hypothetical protein